MPADTPAPVAPGVFVARYLSATGAEESRVALALARENPEEVRRLAAAAGVTLKA